jgi:hypothetical protein
VIPGKGKFRTLEESFVFRVPLFFTPLLMSGNYFWVLWLDFRRDMSLCSMRQGQGLTSHVVGCGLGSVTLLTPSCPERSRAGVQDILPTTSLCRFRIVYNILVIIRPFCVDSMV